MREAKPPIGAAEAKAVSTHREEAARVIRYFSRHEVVVRTTRSQDIDYILWQFAHPARNRPKKAFTPFGGKTRYSHTHKVDLRTGAILERRTPKPEQDQIDNEIKEYPDPPRPEEDLDRYLKKLSTSMPTPSGRGYYYDDTVERSQSFAFIFYLPDCNTKEDRYCSTANLALFSSHHAELSRIQRSTSEERRMSSVTTRQGLIQHVDAAEHEISLRPHYRMPHTEYAVAPSRRALKKGAIAARDDTPHKRLLALRVRQYVRRTLGFDCPVLILDGIYPVREYTLEQQLWDVLEFPVGKV